jgi:glycine cleavage system H protein
MTTRYTKSHEYVRVEGDVGVVGITDYAQTQLGDVVFVELPPVGQSLPAGAEAATVESVKAASEINAPVSGTVVDDVSITLVPRQHRQHCRSQHVAFFWRVWARIT